MASPADTSEGAAPNVGDALKATQAGQLPIGTVADILNRAPSDIVEETIEIPEWGCSVKLRSFTAAQSAAIKQTGLAFRGETTDVAWAQMEIMQFLQGVVSPSFVEDQVRQLHATSGRGFARVIGWLDEKSNIDKEALRKAREEFPGSQQPAEV